MEQELYKAFWWWFVGLAFGLSLRILWGAVRGNIRRYSDLDDYVRDNAVVLTFVAVSYSALVVMWRATEFVAFLPWLDKIDIVPHVVNAWSIIICFLADVIFAYVIKKVQARFETP